MATTAGLGTFWRLEFDNGRLEYILVNEVQRGMLALLRPAGSIYGRDTSYGKAHSSLRRQLRALPARRAAMPLSEPNSRTLIVGSKRALM